MNDDLVSQQMIAMDVPGGGGSGAPGAMSQLPGSFRAHSVLLSCPRSNGTLKNLKQQPPRTIASAPPKADRRLCA